MSWLPVIGCTYVSCQVWEMRGEIALITMNGPNRKSAGSADVMV